MQGASLLCHYPRDHPNSTLNKTLNTCVACRVPAYYALILRSLTVLEGLALSADPNYKLLGKAYPYMARRLLTDPAPQLRWVTQAVYPRAIEVGGGGGVYKGVEGGELFHWGLGEVKGTGLPLHELPPAPQLRCSSAQVLVLHADSNLHHICPI